LASARTYRYRRLRPEPERGVLLRFDDGRPALVELGMGAGRVLVWTSTLDGFWTDLPLRPVYVPLIHEAVKHVAGYRQPPLSFAAALPIAPDAVIAAVGGSVGDGSEVRVDGAAVEAPVALAPGIHDVEWRGEAGAGGGRIAVNLDRSEADLSTIDAEEVIAAIDRQGGHGTVDPETAVDRSERRQSLWWYLLILAFVALAAETALSNRLSPRAS
jgi:hypothetical protein